MLRSLMISPKNGPWVTFFFFLGLFIYFFHTVLHCIIFKGLKSTLFSSSFLYYVLEELVSIIQYYDVYGSALKSAQR